MPSTTHIIDEVLMKLCQNITEVWIFLRQHIHTQQQGVYNYYIHTINEICWDIFTPATLATFPRFLDFDNCHPLQDRILLMSLETIDRADDGTVNRRLTSHSVGSNNVLFRVLDGIKVVLEVTVNLVKHVIHLHRGIHQLQVRTVVQLHFYVAVSGNLIVIVCKHVHYMRTSCYSLQR